MTYRYRYTHAIPTVFIAEIKDGHTWVPNYLDEIESDHPINHPSLELLVDDEPQTEVVDEPQAPEIVEPPETVEAQEDTTAATGDDEPSDA